MPQPPPGISAERCAELDKIAEDLIADSLCNLPIHDGGILHGLPAFNQYPLPVTNSQEERYDMMKRSEEVAKAVMEGLLGSIVRQGTGNETKGEGDIGEGKEKTKTRQKKRDKDKDKQKQGE